MRTFLYRIYRVFERIIAPGTEYSQRVFARILNEEIRKGDKWLDAGCGHQVFAEWMLSEEQALANRCRIAVGVDFDQEGLKKHRTFRNRLVVRLEDLPIRPDSLDVVTANMVVEHITDPVSVLTEMRKVLKPGGKLVFHTPNLRNWKILLMSYCPDGIKRFLAKLLEGRGEEDVFPAHYRLNTPGEIEKHARNAGLTVHTMYFLNSSATTAYVLPLAIMELMVIRFLQRPSMESRRSNLIAVLRKPNV